VQVRGRHCSAAVSPSACLRTALQCGSEPQCFKFSRTALQCGSAALHWRVPWATDKGAWADETAAMFQHAFTKYHKHGLPSLPAEVPPALMRWLQSKFCLDRQYCTSPLSATLGIFKDADGRITSPTWLKGTMPDNHTRRWKGEAEYGSMQWEKQHWTQSGLVAIRAAD